jgi:hypothetical protein
MQPWGHTHASSARDVYLVLSKPPLDSRGHWLWHNLSSIEPPIWGCAAAREFALMLAAWGYRAWSWDALRRRLFRIRERASSHPSLSIVAPALTARPSFRWQSRVARAIASRLIHPIPFARPFVSVPSLRAFTSFTYRSLDVLSLV